jgi:hypothetical protein
MGNLHDSFRIQILTENLLRRWIGTGWVGCTPSNGPEGSGENQTYVRPLELDVDYGVPLDGDLCKETAPGVFGREFTKASVELDCNSFTPTIKMKTEEQQRQQ